ncbi:unnamed protein product [Protopolystoma xenopodis]|uniref:Uncharacterized protein n=1 Tax=Protopolystoma xenopodis TaxID=117903 RepID=A0A3S5BF99_9PLAT|nr:unnamed protein product [Protopolystoma xenopodis]
MKVILTRFVEFLHDYFKQAQTFWLTEATVGDGKVFALGVPAYQPPDLVERSKASPYWLLFVVASWPPMILGIHKCMLERPGCPIAFGGEPELRSAEKIAKAAAESGMKGWGDMAAVLG